ncbi:MAG: hypothetical protein ACW967_06360, partial [Candidatus Hodarchaeales archaeon]
MFSLNPLLKKSVKFLTCLLFISLFLPVFVEPNQLNSATNNNNTDFEKPIYPSNKISALNSSDP